MTKETKSNEWKELIFKEALGLSGDRKFIRRFIRGYVINYLVGKYFEEREQELEDTADEIKYKIRQNGLTQSHE